ncbi:fibrobacter succinogenes major paralogous domain-containing protein [endosymbiont of Lamellibrachia barhami]|uniref:fibrobacter succinogenes major paralogous domain-containing protein n=1 Tax=endosymbiont of Lamellibrachia barhami TaxID=205975 RepID=UPI001FE99286|nr:fibrobacter succinogenes major paralogous domain-containing protein [endosymbiont of Lamellibrachia barhami]
MKTKLSTMTTACVISTLLITLSPTTLFAQDSKSIPPAVNEYQTVTIGIQQWMSKNLNVGTFRNGEPIPEAKTKMQWEAAYKNEEAAWSYYNNDSANGKKYGRLYNWYAVNDPRGLAIKGWHVPTDKEWETLITTLGGKGVAFSKMKSPTGFGALSGGERYYKDAGFYKKGTIGFWWSSTKNDKWNAWYRALHFGYSQVGRDNGGMNTGFSVRLVKGEQ